MHRIVDIEKSFAELSKEENLEWVDCIPSIPTGHYIKCWKVITEILIGNSVSEIELMVGFLGEYPYELPDIYFFDKKYDYMPHINHKTRKLCYIEDGVTYDTSNCTDVLRDCLHRAKRLIEEGANKTNIEDFASEINSYWFAQYNNEPMPIFELLLFGSLPIESSLLDLYSYTENHTEVKSMVRYVLTKQKDESAFTSYISSKTNVTRSCALYINSLEISDRPPYSLSIKQLVGYIQDKNDLKLLILYLNRNRSLMIVFKLFNSDRFGGVLIPKQPTKRKGFREGISAYDELVKFEKQNVPLQRVMGEVYSSELKKKREIPVACNMMKFTVVGLGSIGSNLCYYLMSYSNIEFTLVDDDILRSENTGRHLLGFRYIGQPKSYALKEYIKGKIPESSVNAYAESILDNFENRLKQINDSSAIFVCVGDAMVEEFMLQNIQIQKITSPMFILWLEPYSIAGHMVYINPKSLDKSLRLTEGNLKLYKYNLIHPDMYKLRSEEFVEHDAGCNGAFALYNQNNVTLFLSSLYSVIDELIMNPGESKCYRWVGNINIANQKGLSLTNYSVKKGDLSILPI